MKNLKKLIISMMIVLTVITSLVIPASASSQSYAGKVTTGSGNLNVRSSPSSSASVITSIKKSAWVTLTQKSGSWWKVKYANGKYGWCHADYIKKYDSSYAMTVSVSSGNLNVRSGAGTSYAVKAKLPKGETVVRISDADGWTRILYNGNKTGYVSSSYLKKVTSGTTYSKITMSVPSFKQTDSRWASYPIGTYGDTIGTIGCTTTALAMTESYHQGTTINPKAMAQKLSYSASGMLYWPTYYATELADSSYLSRIYALLKSGKPVVFGATKSNGSQHWVTVTGYSANTSSLSAKYFTINDPGSNSRTTLADFVSAYPNAYKIVYRK